MIIIDFIIYLIYMLFIFFSDDLLNLTFES